MRKLLAILFLMVFSISGVYAQCKDCHEGINYSQQNNNDNHRTARIADSSGGLAKSYIRENVCGLNWEQTSVLVTTRYGPTPGQGLPATLPITFDSCTNVDSLFNAFIYFNGSYYTNYAANPAIVSITNPVAQVFTYNVDSIGTGPSKCWGEKGTIAYRGDISTCIKGGGNYKVMITGTGLDSKSIDGITILLVYKDQSATYTGSIVIYDGLWTGGGSKSQTFNGFNVCQATPTGQAFSIQADMQSNANADKNVETYNGSTGTFANLFYNFCTLTTSLTTGQNTTTYNTYTNNGGDCYSWVIAGLYWQNTNCATCVPNVIATNTLTITPPLDTICQGDSVQLKAKGDSSYVWSPATGLSCTNCPNPKASPNATTTYSVTGYIGCTIGTDTCRIVVSPKIAPIISPANPGICPGGSIQLNASGGINYVWKPAASLSCNTCPNPIASPSVTTTYTVVEGANGCKDSATVTVTVTPTPTITVTPPNSTVCSGVPEQLQANGAASYTWTPLIGLSCYNCSNPIATPTLTTVYKIIGSTNGCMDSITDTVHVAPAPTPTVTAAQDSICAGQKTVLTGSGGGTYKWAPGGGTYDTAQVHPGTYTLTVTKNGCPASISITIFAKSKIPVSTTLSKDNICPYDSTTITARGGTAYKWQPGGSTDTIIHILPGFTRSYTVYITTPCGVDTLKQPVNVLPLPNIKTSGDTTICNTTSANISVSGGGTYSWNPSSTLTCNTCPNPIASPTVTTTYTITVTSVNGCSKDTTITVTVKNKIGSITPNQKVCTGSDVPLTAGPPGDTYKWSTGATTSTITINPLTNVCYTVIVSNGCPDTLQTCLTVKPLPVVTAFFTDSYDTITINRSDTAWMIATSSVNTYSWTPTLDLSCYTCPNPMATPSVTTTYTITSDSGGCITQRTLTVYVEVPCADFKVPNVFTPNNDGRNDDFVVNVLNPTSYSIAIFDRWGKEVYTSTNPTEYWTGHILSTQDMVPDGVYYYTIKASCATNSYTKQGFVQVLTGK